MSHLDLISRLDNQLNSDRLEIIVEHLEKMDINYSIQDYSTGRNVIVDLGRGAKRIGISSHFDRVQNSAGANDNGSAIAVCLDIIKKHTTSSLETSLRVFFFDEEENGLKGSTAYVRERGVKDIIGLMNMEMVGLGDKFALWPVNGLANGQLLRCFESTAKEKGVVSQRFDRIVTNTSDHASFLKGGLVDVFTISCISDKDIETAKHYFKAMEFNVDRETLVEILSAAPIFQHYHRPTDTYEKLSEEAIVRTSEVLWDTIINMNVSDR